MRYKRKSKEKSDNINFKSTMLMTYAHKMVCDDPLQMYYFILVGDGNCDMYTSFSPLQTREIPLNQNPSGKSLDLS